MPAAAGDGRVRSIAAVVAGASIVGLVLSLTLPLLAIRMEEAGASATFIGANSAMPALAILLVTPFLPRLLGRFGTAPVLMWCLLLTAGTLALFHPIGNLWWWFPLRFLNGIGLVSIFVISESWIQAVATRATRGRLVALYTTCFSIGWAGGPAVLATLGTQGAAPFAAGVVLILAAAGVIAWGRDVAPRLGGRSPRAAWSFLAERPAVFGAIICFSAIEAGIFTLLPVYGLRVGLAEGQAALTLTAVGLGSAALQYPIGMLSDRIGRHPVLVLCALTGVAGAVSLPAFAGNPPLLYASMFLWAGVVAGLYTTAMAALGDTYEGADLVAATATFTVMYGIGALAGPPVAGLSMDALDPHGLAVMLGAVCAVYAVLAGVRGMRSRRLTSGAGEGM